MNDAPKNEKKETAIVTVLGQDRTGIVASVAAILAEGGANIEDISQSILTNIFTMTIIVTLDESVMSFMQLQENLLTNGEKLGVQINLQRADVFRYMHRI